MVVNDFRKNLIQKSADEIIKFISDNRDSIRHMFLSNTFEEEDITHFEEIMYLLISKGFSNEQIDSEQLQSLFVYLAYFFKSAKRYEYIDTCHGQISNIYFKTRLDAWIKTRRYHSYAEHVEGFENYLEILTNASEQNDDGNCNEILQDLKEYHEYITKNLSIEYLTKINDFIYDTDSQAIYPLLAQYVSGESDEIADLDIEVYNEEELTPSDFSNKIFNDCFLNKIKYESGADFPSKLFGYHSSKIRYDIIQQGQADYDLEYDNLSPEDISDLYCYFNMRMHFYSSLSLYNRSKIAEQYYNNSGKIKFIDIGCGPATSGLAFTEYLLKKTNENVIFDYYGIDSSKAMQKKANQIMTNEIFETSNHLLFFDLVNDIDLNLFANSTCIIINCCFVFASKTLDIEALANYINKIAEAYPYTPKYLLYQNSTKEKLNESFDEFKKMISVKVELSNQETIKYHNSQNSFFPPKSITGKFELLKLK